jgi:hypothetical protein
MLDHNLPVAGKTYSLFGSDVSTNFFYERVSYVTNHILKDEQSHSAQLLEYLINVNRNRRGFKRNSRGNNSSSRLSKILELLHDEFHKYAHGVEDHLRSLPFHKVFTDKGLFTNREQYYLYMIEFELVNRVHREEFLKANFKIALLPYCLRETQDHCKAVPDQFDYQCKGCLKDCQINHVSRLLREHQVEPYIWRRAKLKPMLKELVKEHGRIGVLGIACIVELVMGMRLCTAAHLPVVGIPLNANRCPRWMDGFYETSVDLKALEDLLSPYK